MKRTLALGVIATLMGVNTLMAQDEFDWQALGEKTFMTSCAGCHAAQGTGLPGSFPPHAGHLPNVVAKEGGREYLIKVLLYGLRGEIQVKGATFNGIMPSWSMLSDEQIAAALNHELHSWGNAEMLPEGFTPILPGDVKAQRESKLTADDTYALRQTLGLSADE